MLSRRYILHLFYALHLSHFKSCNESNIRGNNKICNKTDIFGSMVCKLSLIALEWMSIWLKMVGFMCTLLKFLICKQRIYMHSRNANVFYIDQNRWSFWMWMVFLLEFLTSMMWMSGHPSIPGQRLRNCTSALSLKQSPKYSNVVK